LSRDLLSLLLSLLLLLLLLLLHASQHLQLVEQHTRNSNSAVLHARKPPRSTTGCLTKTLQPYKQTLSSFLYNKMLQQHWPYQLYCCFFSGRSSCTATESLPPFLQAD
jgi:hypothetical protein